MKLKEDLYETTLGKIFLNAIIKNRVTNKLAGKFASSIASRPVIRNFERAYHIDRSLFVSPHKDGFHTLNEFFIRDYKPEIIRRAFNQEKIKKGLLISPAEGFLSLQTNISPESIIQAKDMDYSLFELLKNKELARKYEGGTLMRIRLTPREYHHIHYFDNGRITGFKDIKGKYYTSDHNGLNNIKNIFCKSHRHITEILTSQFGPVVFVEVGATFVGSIVQNNELGDQVRYGEKKSHFKFGGSTLILLFEKGRLKLDKGILSAAGGNGEVYVNLGEIIGKAE